MDLEHGDLTEKIIGAAIDVHRTLGPGFIESIYENALVFELTRRGMTVEQQFRVPIFYAGRHVGTHELDLFVDSLIVVELKAIKELEDIHFAIVRSYLKAVNCEHGLLLNFGKLKLDIRRVGIRAT